MYLMYLSNYTDVGERYLLLEKQVEGLVFKDAASAQHYFNNLWHIKNKIGYWEKSSYRLEPIKIYGE